MGLLTGQTVAQGDFVSTSAGAGDSGKAPKLNGSGVLSDTFIPIKIETTAGATHSLTTTAGQRVVVWAKGDTGDSAGSGTFNLQYDGVTKDTYVFANTGGRSSFSLMYTESPSAGTRNITITGTLFQPKIIVMIIG